MELLYSKVRPFPVNDGDKLIADTIISQIEKSDKVEIAVGYVSVASLEELEFLVDKNHLKEIHLIIGMYYYDGMPENSYNTATRINKKWKNAGIGEIRIVIPFTYHGKLYCFYKGEKAISAIIGSANLSVLKPDATIKRQYELSCFTESPTELEDIKKHINNLKDIRYSKPIDEVTDIKLIRQDNTALNDIELVTKLSVQEIGIYQNSNTIIKFNLLLKVPYFEDRFKDDGKHYTKSNINVCYAAPRSGRKSRDWYECQITVGSNIYKQPGYPQKNMPFYIITDDGYCFKAHTTSDNNKQFSAVGDELIMGRWLKGRLEAAGLVKRVNDTQLDKERCGMITNEILAQYGCDSLEFRKTDQKRKNEEGKELDVWTLSFKSGENNEWQIIS